MLYFKGHWDDNCWKNGKDRHIFFIGLCPKPLKRDGCYIGYQIHMHQVVHSIHFFFVIYFYVHIYIISVFQWEKILDKTYFFGSFDLIPEPKIHNGWYSLYVILSLFCKLIYCVFVYVIWFWNISKSKKSKSTHDK